MARGQTRHVEDWFRQHPNEDAEATRIGGDVGYSRDEVINAVRGLRSKGMRILSVRQGVYKFDTKDQPVKPEPKQVGVGLMMEVIAITKTSKLVCKGEDGMLYIAGEAEF